MSNKLTPGSNKRWESSRMMLPEHIQALNDHAFEKTKVTRPVLDDQEIEKINRALIQAISAKRSLELTYFDCGFIKKISGFVRRFDQVNKVLYMNDAEGLLRFFNFEDILNAEIS